MTVSEITPYPNYPTSFNTCKYINMFYAIKLYIWIQNHRPRHNLRSIEQFRADTTFRTRGTGEKMV